MKFAKKFELALNMLVHSKLRSWLTIIGIVIGIGSVVAIMAISEGAQQQMEENLASMNTEQITISAGMSRAMSFGPRRDFGGGASGVSDEDEEDPELATKDLLVARSVDNVRIAVGLVSSNEEMIYSSKKADVLITAVDSQYWENIVDEEISDGRGLVSSDVYSVVIGGDVAENTFDGIQINRQLTIGGRTFKVVGILESGRGCYISLKAVEVLEDKEKGVYDSIIAFADDADLVENTTSDIESALMLSRGILFDRDKDFSVSNMLSMQETISDTLESISLFLGAIAAISLLVGGIGIANTMFTSVLEKTKEIGILKAIGSKNGDILSIFLINSGLIGLVGGIGGIVVGFVASLFVGSLTGGTSGGGMRGGMMLFGGSSYISFGLILFALGFSVIIGMVAGLIPAYRASRLKPVEALRYE